MQIYIFFINRAFFFIHTGLTHHISSKKKRYSMLQPALRILVTRLPLPNLSPQGSIHASIPIVIVIVISSHFTT